MKLRQPLSTTSRNQQQEQTKSSPGQQASAPKKSGGGLKLFALAVTGFTVGIGYATLNPDSRRQIESYVPQSHLLFDYIDGLLNKAKTQLPTLAPTPKPESVPAPIKPSPASSKP